mgnify:CR=1 FL=1
MFAKVTESYSRVWLYKNANPILKSSRDYLIFMRHPFPTELTIIIALLLLPAVLSGCVAAGAAAGGAAGAKLADDSEDRKDLEYWLKTNDHTSRIGTAMKRENIVEGMSPTQVKLVLGAKKRYNSLPDSTTTIEGGYTQWTYIPELTQYSTYRITFDTTNSVSRTDQVETGDDQMPEPPRG